MKRRHPRLRLALAFVALGLVTTVAVAMCMTLLVDVEQGVASQAQAYIDEETWSVTRWDRPGAVRIKSVRLRGRDWGPQQAAGPPNTPRLGDQVSAWASSTSDGGSEWLILEYAKPVIPRRIDVYESNAPGALTRVTVFDASGREIEAWSGSDPSAGAGGSGATPVSSIPVTLDVPTSKVKLYIASDKVPGWNEIDAVGLIGDKGDTQWARRVTASSTYGSVSSGLGSGPGGRPELLVPSWTRMDQKSADLINGLTSREDRQVDARGWPMLALWAETDLMGVGVPGGGSSSGSAATTVLGSGFNSSFSGTVAVSNGSATGGGPTPVPYRPIWVGLVADTVVFGLAWFVLWATLVVPRRFVREVGRLRRGGCVRCGYDLGYDFVRGCPECGWRREGESAPPTSRVTASEPTNGVGNDARETSPRSSS
jgi:hypothetical protein